MTLSSGEVWGHLSGGEGCSTWALLSPLGMGQVRHLGKGSCCHTLTCPGLLSASRCSVPPLSLDSSPSEFCGITFSKPPYLTLCRYLGGDLSPLPGSPFTSWASGSSWTHLYLPIPVMHTGPKEVSLGSHFCPPIPVLPGGTPAPPPQALSARSFSRSAPVLLKLS